jgi:hypothetical protein
VRSWWKAYHQYGWSGLEFKTQRPKTIHRKDEKAVRPSHRVKYKIRLGSKARIAAYMKGEGIRI